jgi:glycosyltransferase involved in cell wall biosynthesis
MALLPQTIPARPMPEPPLHIALHDVSKESWLGGTEYIHNLVRAVRSLPVPEQPKLTLLQSVWGKPARHMVITPLIEIVQAYPGDARSWWAWLRRLGRQAIHGRVYRTYTQVLRERRADVIFPMVQAPAQPLPVPWIGWAWDMQHKYLPDYFPPEGIARRDAMFAGMAAAAPLIVVSSQSALSDFARYFPGTRDRLRILSFATVPLPEWFAADAEAVRQKYGLPEKFLAVPNAFWVHKNHRLAFEAVRQVVAEGLDVYLACTGTTHDRRRPDYFPELERFVEANGLQRHIRILGVLPRDEQVQVLRAAAGIVQPSLFEGWSTVVEDARALGKCILLSDIPVHREQQPPGATYFDPANPAPLAQALRGIWPKLVPGPDLAAEERALVQQAATVTQFARRFVDIAREGATLGVQPIERQ